MIRELGLSRVAVSSTTTNWSPPYALKDMKRIVKFGGSRIVPVLWVTKWMLDSGFIDKALGSGIRWGCLKVHGELENGVWQSDTAEMSLVVSLARSLDVPLLIHTGPSAYCHAALYGEAVHKNPDMDFILAHGSPIDETMELLALPNAFADTAVMPIEHIGMLVEAGYAHKVLWGTDSPMDRPFAKYVSPAKYCHKRLDGFFHAVTDRDARRMILYDNFQKLFGEVAA